MSLKNPNDGGEFEDGKAALPVANQEAVPWPVQLRLVNKKIPMRYCEFKISNNHAKMLNGETASISNHGLLFNAAVAFSVGSLLRVWVEMPDYWARKSRRVDYRQTEAPTYFQVLARVVHAVELGKKGSKHQLTCQILNLDPVDEEVLVDYLGQSYGVGAP